MTSESIDWIYDLNPVQYNYRIKDDETGEWTEEVETELDYGLIAEEVEPINVELCDYDETPDGGQELATVQYKKLTAPMLRAIQILLVLKYWKQRLALKSQLNTKKRIIMSSKARELSKFSFDIHVNEGAVL